MNRNTSGAVLLLILAAAGLHVGNGWTVALVIATAALAFLTEEVRGTLDPTGQGVPLHAAAFILALGSWVTVALAMLSLLL